MIKVDHSFSGSDYVLCIYLKFLMNEELNLYITVVKSAYELTLSFVNLYEYYYVSYIK